MQLRCALRRRLVNDVTITRNGKVTYNIVPVRLST